MVVVPQEAGGPGGPLADRPLHDGVRAVREGGAVLSDGAVHEAQVLERVNLKFHDVRISVVFSSSGYSFQVELRDSRGIIGHSSVQRLEKNKCCDCPGYNNNMRDVKSGPIQSLF